MEIVYAADASDECRNREVTFKYSGYTDSDGKTDSEEMVRSLGVFIIRDNDIRNMWHSDPTKIINC